MTIAGRDIVAHRSAARERTLQALQEKAHQKALKRNRRKREQKAQRKREDAEFTRNLIKNAQIMAKFVKVQGLFDDVDETTADSAKFVLSQKDKLKKMNVRLRKAACAPNTAVEKQMAKEGLFKPQMP